jgi:hypothetical protein
MSTRHAQTALRMFDNLREAVSNNDLKSASEYGTAVDLHTQLEIAAQIERLADVFVNMENAAKVIVGMVMASPDLRNEMRKAGIPVEMLGLFEMPTDNEH